MKTIWLLRNKFNKDNKFMSNQPNSKMGMSMMNHKLNFNMSMKMIITHQSLIGKGYEGKSNGVDNNKNNSWLNKIIIMIFKSEMSKLRIMKNKMITFQKNMIMQKYLWLNKVKRKTSHNLKVIMRCFRIMRWEIK